MMYSQIYLSKFFFQISTCNPTILNNKVTDVNKKRRPNSGKKKTTKHFPLKSNKLLEPIRTHLYY